MHQCEYNVKTDFKVEDLSTRERRLLKKTFDILLETVDNLFTNQVKYYWNKLPKSVSKPPSWKIFKAHFESSRKRLTNLA